MNFITFLSLMPKSRTMTTSRKVESNGRTELKPLTGFDYVLIGSAVVMLVCLVVHLVV